MSDGVFFQHYNLRHVPDEVAAISVRFSETLSRGYKRAFRAWHRRDHALRPDAFDHVHLED